MDEELRDMMDMEADKLKEMEDVAKRLAKLSKTKIASGAKNTLDEMLSAFEAGEFEFNRNTSFSTWDEVDLMDIGQVGMSYDFKVNDEGKGAITLSIFTTDFEGNDVEATSVIKVNNAKEALTVMLNGFEDVGANQIFNHETDEKFYVESIKGDVVERILAGESIRDVLLNASEATLELEDDDTEEEIE